MKARRAVRGRGPGMAGGLFESIFAPGAKNIRSAEKEVAARPRAKEPKRSRARVRELKVSSTFSKVAEVWGQSPQGLDLKTAVQKATVRGTSSLLQQSSRRGKAAPPSTCHRQVRARSTKGRPADCLLPAETGRKAQRAQTRSPCAAAEGLRSKSFRASLFESGKCRRKSLSFPTHRNPCGRKGEAFIVFSYRA